MAFTSFTVLCVRNERLYGLGEFKLDTLKLFKRSNSGMGYWQIEVHENEEGHGVITRTFSKKLDGKPIIKLKVIKKGKNLGKSNETTPFTQAQNEARSESNGQLDGGYKHSIEQVGPFHTNQLGHPLPMLAKRIEKIKNLDFSGFAETSPKLDGHRCTTVRTKEGILQYSKEGKRIQTLDHMHEELMDTLEVGEYLDGELYNHNLTLQEIASLVKKQQPESDSIKYYVYDSFSVDKSYQERFVDRFHCDDTSGVLVPIERHPVTSLEECWKWFDDFVSRGYEGGMLRLGDGGYEVGARSNNLLKLKAELDAEFIVMDITEGEPYIQVDGVTGVETTYRVGILHLRTDNGQPFTVTAPGTYANKELILIDKAKYIGQLLNITYPNLTPDGIPFHPVARYFKEFIGD